MLEDNNKKKSEDKTRIKLNGYLTTDPLLLYGLLLSTLVSELQRPIFERVPCEFQQRQDHSVFKENKLIICMVNIFIVLLQRTSVEQIYGKAILVNSNYFLKGTNPL